MTLGFKADGTVSSYASGVEPPGGRAIWARQDEHDMLKDYIQNDIPLEDRVLIVRALVDKADMVRKMTLRKQYQGNSQAQVAQRNALKFEASECERVAKTLCEAWGLRWKDRR